MILPCQLGASKGAVEKVINIRCMKCLYMLKYNVKALQSFAATIYLIQLYVSSGQITHFSLELHPLQT